MNKQLYFICRSSDYDNKKYNIQALRLFFEFFGYDIIFFREDLSTASHPRDKYKEWYKNADAILIFWSKNWLCIDDNNFSTVTLDADNIEDRSDIIDEVLDVYNMNGGRKSIKPVLVYCLDSQHKEYSTILQEKVIHELFTGNDCIEFKTQYSFTEKMFNIINKLGEKLTYPRINENVAYATQRRIYEPPNEKPLINTILEYIQSEKVNENYSYKLHPLKKLEVASELFECYLNSDSKNIIVLIPIVNSILKIENHEAIIEHILKLKEENKDIEKIIFAIPDINCFSDANKYYQLSKGNEREDFHELMCRAEMHFNIVRAKYFSMDNSPTISLILFLIPFWKIKKSINHAK